MPHESLLFDHKWGKIFFLTIVKTQVPGVQSKTNNIKIDSENKSIFVI